MTKTDFSVLAALTSQASGPAKTGGLSDGGGAFLACLGQGTVKKQSSDPFPTSHATFPQTVESSFDLSGDMIRTANLQTDQSAVDPLSMAGWGPNFDQQANGLSFENPQIVNPEHAKHANESTIQTDDTILNAKSLRLGTETPTLFSTNPPTNGIATAQLPTPPHGTWMPATTSARALTNGFQQTDTLDEQTLKNATPGLFHRNPESLPTAQPLEQISPTTGQPHASPTADSTLAPTGALSPTFAKPHGFKTSELAPNDIGVSKAQETNALQRLGDNNAINAEPAAASASSKFGFSEDLTPERLPAERDEPTNTKATGFVPSINQAGLAKDFNSRISSLPLPLEKAQQNISQIAPQLAQSAPTIVAETLKPQTTRPEADVMLAPLTTKRQESVVPLAQSLGVQVRTILQPSPQQTGAIPNAPPVVQGDPDKSSPEIAFDRTSIASAKSPDTLIAPRGDTSDLAQYSEKKSLYGNVFSSTGFSTSTTISPTAQAYSVQPNAVPIAAIADQIKAHSTPGKPSTIELTLTPEDLGKIRLVMVPEGDKIRIVVHTDRPETMDLIRRNTDAFSADLRQAGYSNASFSFGGSNGRQTDHQDQHGSGPTYELTADDADPSPSNAKSQAEQPKLGGLNLRV